MNEPRLQPLANEYVVGEKIIFECEVGDALPAANVIWEYLNQKENKWIDATAESVLKPSIESRVTIEFDVLKFLKAV